MDVSRLWRKTFPVRRGLLALFIAWHLAAITLNNLPWSPLVEATFDTYRPYLGYTGTVQDGWSMYGDVHEADNHYRLIGVDAAGREFPIAFPGQTLVGKVAWRPRDFWEEREASFLESMGYGVPDEVQQAFGLYLCRIAPRAVSVRLDMMTAVIPPLAEWTGPPRPQEYGVLATHPTDCPRRS